MDKNERCKSKRTYDLPAPNNNTNKLHMTHLYGRVGEDGLREYPDAVVLLFFLISKESMNNLMTWHRNLEFCDELLRNLALRVLVFVNSAAVMRFKLFTVEILKTDYF